MLIRGVRVDRTRVLKLLALPFLAPLIALALLDDWRRDWKRTPCSFHRGRADRWNRRCADCLDATLTTDDPAEHPRLARSDWFPVEVTRSSGT